MRRGESGSAGAWRLLLDREAAGPWNMAVDEALLDSAARGGRPALRLYAWRGAWLSLGYGQRCDDAQRAACRAAGVGVVRRATGGGAVLHGGDLTYAVAAPMERLPDGLAASYAWIARALCAGLRRLGVAVETGARGTAAPARAFDCFAEARADALCAAGRKLVGSAQRRAGGAVLQHGSLRLHPDPPAVRVAAGLRAESATSLRELGCSAGEGALRSALVEAFASTLGLRLEPDELTPEEVARARTAAARPRPVAPASAASSASGISRAPSGRR